MKFAAVIFLLPLPVFAQMEEQRKGAPMEELREAAPIEKQPQSPTMEEQREIEAEGVVESYSPETQSFMLRGAEKDGQPVNVYVTKTTTIYGEDGKPIGATAVTAGQNVRVTYQWIDGKWVARQITYRQPTAAPTPATTAVETTGEPVLQVPTSAVDGDITTQPPRDAAYDGDITTQPPRDAAYDGDVTTVPPKVPVR